MQPLYITVTDNTGKEVHTTGKGPTVTSAILDIFGTDRAGHPAVIATISVHAHHDPNDYSIAIRKRHPQLPITILSDDAT